MKPQLFNAIVSRINKETMNLIYGKRFQFKFKCIFCKQESELESDFRYYFDNSEETKYKCDEIVEYSFRLCYYCYSTRISKKHLYKLKHIIPIIKLKEKLRGRRMEMAGGVEEYYKRSSWDDEWKDIIYNQKIEIEG